MRVVEYEMDMIVVEELYTNPKVILECINERANKGWIYKEEIKSTTKSVRLFLFFKFDQEYLTYNQELLQYIKP